MSKKRLNLIEVIIVAVFVFSIVFPAPINRAIDFANTGVKHIGFNIPHIPDVGFKLGLDLQGGSHLVYEADLSAVEDKGESMEGLRDVIERRVNYFGISEPIVRIEEKGESRRLIVELAGVMDMNEAIKMIGETPFLEFMEQRTEEDTQRILEQIEQGIITNEDPYFIPTNLTGKYLKGAQIAFDQTGINPYVTIEFDSQGSKIFESMTSENVGKRLAIYIDKVLISAPVVQEAITGGKAQITGDFTIQEVKELARNLNAGALPVPIKLISQTTVGPTLGKISLEKSLKAGMYGFIAVVLFMLVFYRLSGLFASLSLLIYGIILLCIFKLLPVTLTLAGIGGAVLSIGMAVDANVLIFERQREERKQGESYSNALANGFHRAWPSIRDGNVTTLIVAFIMFAFGTSFVKGFAVTLGLGILTSLFSALFVTKVFLKLFVNTKLEKIKWLWN